MQMHVRADRRFLLGFLSSCAALMLLIVAAGMHPQVRRTSLDSFTPPIISFEDHAKTIGYPFAETGGGSKAADEVKKMKNSSPKRGNDRLWRSSRWIPEGRHPSEADLDQEDQRRAMDTLVQAGIVCKDCLVTVPLADKRLAKAVGF